MLTESKTIDQVLIDQNNIVHLRETTVVFRDGEEIARTYHRTTLTEGSAIGNLPANVQAICQAAWYAH